MLSRELEGGQKEREKEKERERETDRRFVGWNGKKKVASVLRARKRPPYRSVVALAESLGNAEHDQMNQQRQLIARQRPWKSVGTPPPPPASAVRTTDLSMCSEHTFEGCQKREGRLLNRRDLISMR